jgi:uncharacterized protein YjiS (DUF1127 family)
MPTPTHSLRPSLALVATRAGASLADRWRELRSRWQRRHALRATYRSLAGLDEALLRDIGIHRGRLWAVAAQTVGAAEAAHRVRVACSIFAPHVRH